MGLTNRENEKLLLRIVQIETQLKEKDSQLQKMLRSKSWRITSPMRKIAHEMKRIRTFLKTFLLLISWSKKNRHRIPFFLKKGLRVLRQEGISSLYRKIRRKAVMNGIGITSPQDFYQEWILRNDTITSEDRKNIQKRIRSLSIKPSFSVILPVYKTSEKFLTEAIDSVKHQLYPYWELCIANDASTLPHVQKILDQARDSDSRIKVIHRAINGHISQSSNSAIELASGDFFIFLDHDDLLSEHALYMIAEEINAYPDADLHYSDEDKIDENGLRFDPHFKSDWNFDLFMSYNYLCHITAIRASMVREIGGFRSGVEGAQDYDLLLRCIRTMQDPNKIRHIPHILYHWRSHPGSTALSTDEKPYAHFAGLKSLKDYWETIDPRIEVLDGPFSCTYRIKYPLPDNPPLVSILMPTGGGYETLKRCLDSIRAKTTYGNYEILIDNGNKSKDAINYLEKLEKEWCVRIIRKTRPENFLFNYSAMNNLLAKNARGEVLVLLNDDIEIIDPEWLEELVRQSLRPDVGVVGAKLLYPDGRLQHAGIILGVGGDTGGHAFRYLDQRETGYLCRAQVSQNFSAMTGACLALRRNLYRDVDGLEEELAVTCNDVDLCLRILTKGFRNVWNPFVRLYHYESTTRGQDDTPEKKERFRWETGYMREKWNEIISNDPAYNPNLSFESENFDIAPESRAKKPWSNKKTAQQNSLLINNGVKVSAIPVFQPVSKKLKILVIKLDHRGDMLSALPALLRLREKFTEADIDLICGPWNIPLVEKFHLFRKIYPLNFFQDVSKHGIERSINEERLLLNQLDRYDIAIDLRSYAETRILLSKVEALFRVGYRSFSEADGILDICLEGAEDTSRHVSLKLLDLVNAIPYETFAFPSLSLGKVDGIDRKIGIFPFAGSSARQWPLENFIGLVEKLSCFLHEWKINVYIPSEEADSALLFEKDHPNVSVFVDLSLKDLIDSLGGCEIVVANNSFGAHLPGYLGSKVVITIFSGAVLVEEWKGSVGRQKVFYSDISCSPCYLTHSSDCPYDMLCVKQISVDTIFDAVSAETGVEVQNESLKSQLFRY